MSELFNFGFLVGSNKEAGLADMARSGLTAAGGALGRGAGAVRAAVGAIPGELRTFGKHLSGSAARSARETSEMFPFSKSRPLPEMAAEAGKLEKARDDARLLTGLLGLDAVGLSGAGYLAHREFNKKANLASSIGGALAATASRVGGAASRGAMSAARTLTPMVENMGTHLTSTIPKAIQGLPENFMRVARNTPTNIADGLNAYGSNMTGMAAAKAEAMARRASTAVSRTAAKNEAASAAAATARANRPASPGGANARQRFQDAAAKKLEQDGVDALKAKTLLAKQLGQKAEDTRGNSSVARLLTGLGIVGAARYPYDSNRPWIGSYDPAAKEAGLASFGAGLLNHGAAAATKLMAGGRAAQAASKHIVRGAGGLVQGAGNVVGAAGDLAGGVGRVGQQLGQKTVALGDAASKALGSKAGPIARDALHAVGHVTRLGGKAMSTLGAGARAINTGATAAGEGIKAVSKSNIGAPLALGGAGLAAYGGLPNGVQNPFTFGQSVGQETSAPGRSWFGGGGGGGGGGGRPDAYRKEPGIPESAAQRRSYRTGAPFNY